MNYNVSINLPDKDYLTQSISEQGEVLEYFLKNPKSFLLDSVIQRIKEGYVHNEEKGGYIIFQPIKIKERWNFEASQVIFLENCIENYPQFRRTKENAYLPDLEQKKNVFSSALDKGLIPIGFHTHPSKGDNSLERVFNSYFNKNTSEQDRFACSQTKSVNGKKLLLPEILVVGDDNLTGEVFVGIYGGNVAPLNFEESREGNLVAELECMSEKINKIELSENQKTLSIVALIALVLLIIKYNKTSIPLILSALASAPFMLEVLSNKNHQFVHSNSFEDKLEISL